MSHFPESLVSAVREYLRIQKLRNLALPDEMKESFCQLMVNSGLLNGFDEPNKILERMLKSLDSDYRCAHPEGGSRRLVIESAAFKKFNSEATRWIALTCFDDLCSLASECRYVPVENNFFKPDTMKCLTGEEIHIGNVKYAVVQFVQQPQVSLVASVKVAPSLIPAIQKKTVPVAQPVLVGAAG